MPVREERFWDQERHTCMHLRGIPGIQFDLFPLSLPLRKGWWHQSSAISCARGALLSRERTSSRRTGGGCDSPRVEYVSGGGEGGRRRRRRGEEEGPIAGLDWVSIGVPVPVCPQAAGCRSTDALCLMLMIAIRHSRGHITPRRLQRGG